MAEAMLVTYTCRQCGAKIVVTETLDTQLSPIYCCGVEVAKISSVKKKPSKPKKKAIKKVAKKKIARKKKPALKVSI